MSAKEKADPWAGLTHYEVAVSFHRRECGWLVLKDGVQLRTEVEGCTCGLVAALRALEVEIALMPARPEEDEDPPW